MPELNQILVDNLVIAFAVVIGLLLILILLMAILSVRVGRAMRAYRALLVLRNEYDGARGPRATARWY